MKRRATSVFCLAAMTAAVVFGASTGLHHANAQSPAFGTDEDVDYASTLWEQLQSANMVGEEATLSMPYEGQPPHGGMLGYLEDDVKVGDHTGLAIVKRNYRGDDFTREDVLKSPSDYLESVTIMFRREQGYDPDNANWFWSKHNPDGSLQSNPKGMSLAGRVGKGMDQGCIPCHAAAPGDDYVYTYDLTEATAE